MAEIEKRLRERTGHTVQALKQTAQETGLAHAPELTVTLLRTGISPAPRTLSVGPARLSLQHNGSSPMNRIDGPPFTRVMVIAGFGLLLWATGLPSAAQQAKKDAGSKKARTQLDGEWHLVSSKHPASGRMRSVPAGIEMTKLIVDGRYVWTAVQNGTVIAGGSYTVAGEKYTEKVTYGMTDRQQPMVGRSFTFTWKF